MKILRLQTQGFKRVVAVDITPEDALVRVGGDNGEGKTSLLDSIMAGLGGANAAPIKPVRTGDDFAAIRIELGDGEPALVVTKYFDEHGEKLRVENADGAVFEKGQTEVGKVLGRMTFDPLAFARSPSKDQVAELLRIAPLKVDLDALAKADAADVVARRDVNREGRAAVARRDAINVSGIVPDRPDRDAIVAALGSAGEVNCAIASDRAAREAEDLRANGMTATADRDRERAFELRKEAERFEALAAEREQAADRIRTTLTGLPPLDEPVDTAKLSADLAKADADLALLGRIDERAKLDAEVVRLRTRSEAFTADMVRRAEERAQALAEAAIPVPGLALSRLCDVIPGEESTDLIVTYEGEPFAQASGAQQLRVSMRLAMAANPKLRIMLIREGSLLDGKSMDVVRELAVDGGYQVWIETVGEGDGSGLIMEAGSVRGAPEPERLDGPKRRKAKGVEERGNRLIVDDPRSGETASPQQQAAVDALETAARKMIGESIADQQTPTRRRPSDMRKAPAGDLFGGGD